LLQSIQGSLVEADEISTRTLGTLNEQTEQLQRIDRHTDDIGNNLTQSAQLLRNLRPFGWVKAMFKKEPSGSGGYPSSSSSSSSSRPALAAASSAPARSQGAARLLADDAARRHASGTAPAGARGRPDQQPEEMEKAYDDIDKLLSGLKDKTQVINRTLDHHNEMLPGISDKVERDQERLKSQQQQMKKLFR